MRAPLFSFSAMPAKVPTFAARPATSVGTILAQP